MDYILNLELLDTVNAGTGNDIINSGAGNDIIDAGTGDDIIDAGTGNDTVNGGDGIDKISFDLSSSTSNLTLDTTGSTIVLPLSITLSNVEVFNPTTGSGNDTIKLKGSYNETIATGSGNDTINSGLGSDNVDGGAGTDLLIVDYSTNIYSGISSSIGSSSLGGFNGYFSVYNTPYYDQVYFSNIEQFQITGTGLTDYIYTGSGNDTINGGAGDDYIDSGTGNDTVQQFQIQTVT